MLLFGGKFDNHCQNTWWSYAIWLNKSPIPAQMYKGYVYQDFHWSIFPNNGKLKITWIVMNKELDKLWKCHTLKLLKNRYINPYLATWKDVQNILHEKQEVNKCIQYDFIFEKLKHMYTYMYIFKGLSLRTDLLFAFSLDSNLSESTFLCLKLEYYIHTCYTCKEVQKTKCM